MCMLGCQIGRKCFIKCSECLLSIRSCLIACCVSILLLNSIILSVIYLTSSFISIQKKNVQKDQILQPYVEQFVVNYFGSNRERILHYRARVMNLPENLQFDLRDPNYVEYAMRNVFPLNYLNPVKTGVSFGCGDIYGNGLFFPKNSQVWARIFPDATYFVLHRNGSEKIKPIPNSPHYMGPLWAIPIKVNETSLQPTIQWERKIPYVGNWSHIVAKWYIQGMKFVHTIDDADIVEQQSFGNMLFVSNAGVFDSQGKVLAMIGNGIRGAAIGVFLKNMNLDDHIVFLVNKATHHIFATNKDVDEIPTSYKVEGKGKFYRADDCPNKYVSSVYRSILKETKDYKLHVNNVFRSSRRLNGFVVAVRLTLVENLEVVSVSMIREEVVYAGLLWSIVICVPVSFFYFVIACVLSFIFSLCITKPLNGVIKQMQNIEDMKLDDVHIGKRSLLMEVRHIQRNLTFTTEKLKEYRRFLPMDMLREFMGEEKDEKEEEEEDDDDDNISECSTVMMKSHELNEAITQFRQSNKDVVEVSLVEDEDIQIKSNHSSSSGSSDGSSDGSIISNSSDTGTGSFCSDGNHSSSVGSGSIFGSLSSNGSERRKRRKKNMGRMEVLKKKMKKYDFQAKKKFTTVVLMKIPNVENNDEWGFHLGSHDDEKILQLSKYLFDMIPLVVNRNRGTIYQHSLDRWIFSFPKPCFGLRFCREMGNEIERKKEEKEGNNCYDGLRWRFIIHCGLSVAGIFGSNFSKKKLVVGKLLNTAEKIQSHLEMMSDGNDIFKNEEKEEEEDVKKSGTFKIFLTHQAQQNLRKKHILRPIDVLRLGQEMVFLYSHVETIDGLGKLDEWMYELDRNSRAARYDHMKNGVLNLIQNNLEAAKKMFEESINAFETPNLLSKEKKQETPKKNEKEHLLEQNSDEEVKVAKKEENKQQEEGKKDQVVSSHEEREEVKLLCMRFSKLISILSEKKKLVCDIFPKMGYSILPEVELK